MDPTTRSLEWCLRRAAPYAAACVYLVTGASSIAAQGPSPLAGPRLSDLPEALSGQAAPGLRILTGYASPFRAAEAGTSGGAIGTGNQSYQGEVSWRTEGGRRFLVGIEVNDDPTWGPVRGRRRGKSLVTPALAFEDRLIGGSGLALGLRATVQAVWQGSDPGLFNAGPERDERRFAAYALELPLTLASRDRRSALTFVPSVATLPRTLMGATYYGTALRLGLAGRHDLGAGWRLGAAIELPLGPGDNVVDREGGFRRTAVWWASVGWRAAARVALDATLGNAAGVTPATRHLTLPSAPRVLYGVGIRYTPTASEPPHGVPPTAFTRPGGGRIESALDTRGAWALAAVQSLGHRFAVEVLATRLRGADAPARLEADVGSSWEYRFALALGVGDQADGGWLTWTPRVSVGRDADDQQGYMLAEVLAERRLGARWSLTANPVVIHSGGRSPAAVGAGLRYEVAGVALSGRGHASLGGEGPVWNADAEAPLPLGDPSALRVRLTVTNASGPLGVGRVLADPRGFRLRLGAALRY